MPDPQQQAERAAAWKAYRETVRREHEAWITWYRVRGEAEATSNADGSFTLDGVVYLPDGTTRAAE